MTWWVWLGLWVVTLVLWVREISYAERLERRQEALREELDVWLARVTSVPARSWTADGPLSGRDVPAQSWTGPVCWPPYCCRNCGHCWPDRLASPPDMDERRFRCSQCGHEWVVSGAELAGWRGEEDA